jgi:hypothetical protein
MSEPRPSPPPDATLPGGQGAGGDAWRPGDAGAPSGTGEPVGGSLPGETRPNGLRRPPSERYASAPIPRRAEADHLRSLLLGGAAAALTALAWGLLAGVLDVRPGLLVVVGIGGWAIGLGVRRGAWGGAPHTPSNRGPLVAGLLGAAAWLGGLLVTWVVAQALIRGSTRSLPERLSETPFLEWLLPQVGLLEPIALAVLVGVAAYNARDR